MMPHEDRQTVEDFRWADYEDELNLQADDAITNARKCFCVLRSLLLECPSVVGHYRPAIADLANDFLEVAEQAPRNEP